MKTIKLIFGTYNSQPVGTEDYQFEKVYQESYKPLLKKLYNYPKIPVVLHYSGVLLEWFEDHHPEFMMLLNDMIKRKQVDLLGGGFYDPFLPLIPNTDRLGQIEYLTTFLRKRFGKRPRGGWITESIWEQGIACTIKNSGLDYIFLNEEYFINSGIKPSELFSPYVTEDQGKTLIVYPVLNHLTDITNPNVSRDTITELLKYSSDVEDRIAVIIFKGDEYTIDDARNKTIRKHKRFEEFLSLLETNRDKIKVVLPDKYLKSSSLGKKAYFNSTSYTQLIDWKNHLSKNKKTLAGKSKYPEENQINTNISSYRQVLSRYSESNLLYSKMIYTHNLVNQIRRDKSRKKTAMIELWKGQCSNAYWHRKGGGIYNNNLRKVIYKSLIDAEKLTREKGIFKTSVGSVDFDMDGNNEYLYQGQVINAYVHLKGGMLLELDYLPCSWNYLDTMARYKEPYHKASDEKKGFDWYPRKAFIDHFINAAEKIDNFNSMKYQELGNFINTTYQVIDFDRDRKRLKLEKLGWILEQNVKTPVRLIKKYVFKKNSINVYYSIQNLSKNNIEICFGSEINISFHSDKSDDLSIFKIKDDKKEYLFSQMVSLQDIEEIAAQDLKNKVNISISASKTFNFWCLPVKTNSESYNKSAETYQSTCFMPKWQFCLKSGNTWDVRLNLKLESL